jgi:hypothetical protein
MRVRDGGVDVRPLLGGWRAERQKDAPPHAFHTRLRVASSASSIQAKTKCIDGCAVLNGRPKRGPRHDAVYLQRGRSKHVIKICQARAIDMGPGRYLPRLRDKGSRRICEHDDDEGAGSLRPLLPQHGQQPTAPVDTQRSMLQTKMVGGRSDAQRLVAAWGPPTKSSVVAEPATPCYGCAASEAAQLHSTVDSHRSQPTAHSNCSHRSSLSPKNHAAAYIPRNCACHLGPIHSNLPQSVS